MSLPRLTLSRALLAALLVAGVLVAVSLRDRVPLLSEYCVAEVDGVRAQVDLEQAQWSSLMAATAQRRGLPPRATTIAIATAFQESRLRNIDYGDRDSLGLFQQRPSQGWGTAEQVMDPVYSIDAFYDGLVEVEDYTSMEITDAAQEVQRSAFPEAYAQHEPRSRALASALRGYSPAAFSCQLNAQGVGDDDAVRADVEAAFGPLEQRPLDDAVAYPVAGDEDAQVRGWALAQYVVGNAGRLRVSSVAFDGRRWTLEESTSGWVESAAAAADEVLVTTR